MAHFQVAADALDIVAELDRRVESVHQRLDTPDLVFPAGAQGHGHRKGLEQGRLAADVQQIGFVERGQAAGIALLVDLHGLRVLVPVARVVLPQRRVGGEEPLQVADGSHGEQAGQQQLVDRGIGAVPVDQVVLDANGAKAQESGGEQVGLQQFRSGYEYPLLAVRRAVPQRQVRDAGGGRVLESAPEIAG